MVNINGIAIPFKIKVVQTSEPWRHLAAICYMREVESDLKFGILLAHFPGVSGVIHLFGWY